jgi:DNA-binding SARP family transcriptional activator
MLRMLMLMRARVAAGNSGEALAIYERLRSTLAAELGASPSAATQAAYMDALRST